MAAFTGTADRDVADARNGILIGFTGGSVAELQDATGDQFNAGDGDDAILAGVGNDRLYGENGADVLIGGAGDDQMYGDFGNDIYYVDSVNDQCTESFVFFVGSPPRTTFYSDGLDTVFTTVSYTLPISLIEWLVLQDEGGAINGTGNAISNNIAGNNFDNVLDGAAGHDIILGGRGNDTLIGGQGNDYLAGGLGNDTYHVDSAGDQCVENSNEGTDTVFAVASYVLGANVENLTLQDAGGTISGVGNGDGNTLVGNAVANYLDGGDGDDMIVGLGGDDTLVGGAGGDAIAGGAGTDVIYGGSGVDVVFGEDGADLLCGGAGGDFIQGGLGGDLIVFNVGDDGDLIMNFNEGGVRDGFDLRGFFDATGYTGTDPRGAGLMQVLQNGADTDVYLYGAFAFRIQGVVAAAIDDTYFLFQ